MSLDVTPPFDVQTLLGFPLKKKKTPRRTLNHVSVWPPNTYNPECAVIAALTECISFISSLCLS